MQTSAPLALPTTAPLSTASTAQPVCPAGTLESSELLQGAKAVSILHNGAIYRLQATKLGKLILTK
ncbi:hemin uptake protein HemP [Comamonas odontotermitis]|uniref:hemin uptake protein HemP n=1 Tax=Comamonas odontotermitis TaxID=379895 RepID=UPI001CC4CD37|nr:hemin uptake protein HemP [Comamonas odontotermitis]UBB18406.1 hemin uptake protein HemP [Comamonas odontotermitis]